MISCMLMDEPVPEEIDEDEADLTPVVKIKRDQSSVSTSQLRNQEILRTSYGIHVMDLESVDLVEYRIIQI